MGGVQGDKPVLGQGGSLGSRDHHLRARLSNLEREASNPLSGSVHFVTNHMYSHVRCGLVDKMICEFSELHGWRGKP